MAECEVSSIFKSATRMKELWLRKTGLAKSLVAVLAAVASSSNVGADNTSVVQNLPLVKCRHVQLTSAMVVSMDRMKMKKQ